MLPINLLRKVAARQHGLATSEQAYEAGFSEGSLRRAVDRGHLVRLTPSLLLVHGAPDTQPRRLMAAVLDAGVAAALAAESAGGWWGLPGFPFDQLQVVRPRDAGDRPARLAVVHEVRHLPEHHVRVLEGIPVTVPSRIPFDLANKGVPPWKVERTVDNAWNRGLANHFTFMAMLDDLAERGRTGITLMREIMSTRGPDYVPPASGLEARFNDVITKAGLPAMRRQINVGDETTWIGRVDFLAEDCPLVVEVQSERFHTALLDTKADMMRISRLRAAGFVVVEVTDVDVWHRRLVVVQKVCRGRDEALEPRIGVAGGGIGACEAHVTSGTVIRRGWGSREVHRFAPTSSECWSPSWRSPRAA
jgi:hypothetical protein